MDEITAVSSRLRFSRQQWRLQYERNCFATTEYSQHYLSPGLRIRNCVICYLVTE